MKYAYVRVSTDMQDYTSQRHAIDRLYKVDQYFEDTGSGAVTQPNLLKLIELVKEGDELIVASFDRLGRNMSNVVQIVEKLKKEKINLISIREGVNVNSPSGTMVMQILCSMAEYERALIGDRVKAGMAAAKSNGVQLGRRPKYENDQDRYCAYIQALRKAGHSLITIRSALKKLGIQLSNGSVYYWSKKPTRGIYRFDSNEYFEWKTACQITEKERGLNA